MDRTRLDLAFQPSGSAQSEESALDLERNYCNHQNLLSSSPSPLQPFASGGQLSESQLPMGQQATSLLELMTIRAFHSKILRRFSLGTAIGFRIRRGVLTDIPAILVFVARKVHKQWLSRIQCLPAALEGPGGVWCEVDVVEFSYYGAPAPTPKEQLYNELVDGLRGSDPCIGSGSQVASQETYGTLGAIVRSRTGNRQVGFLTNRHVAVNLDYPNQKMFHPLPPSLGPGVYLGAVERATSFITDDLWYGIFAANNPETFVRADGAFIPFAEDFNMNNVTTSVRGIGEVGEVNTIDLQSPIGSLIGRQVVKVGRSSGLTTGTIMAYALEYNDEKGICFFTDFLVVGENQQTFDLEGDSGSLILLTASNGEKPRPVGIIWGGTANRGRLKLKVGQPPENWTSGVDLGRLLDLLELDLITSSERLQAAVLEQRNASAGNVDSAVGESSPPSRHLSRDKTEENMERFSLNNQQGPLEIDTSQGMRREFHIEDGIEATPSLFRKIASPSEQPTGELELRNLSALASNADAEVTVSLQLGEPEPKRRKQSDFQL
ncbi:hypothetical protein NL676_012220 [Syzygium grande]|nr:hypothetical protein NL676_012220 [Syzygium grande]